MLEISNIRENKENVIAALAKRGLDVSSTIDKILSLDDERKTTQNQVDGILAEINRLSKEIGKLMQAGDHDGGNKMKGLVAELKDSVKDKEIRQNEVEEGIKTLLYTIPNAPNMRVPNGRSANDNENIFENQVTVSLPGSAMPHWDLAKKYDLIDFIKAKEPNYNAL